MTGAIEGVAGSRRERAAGRSTLLFLAMVPILTRWPTVAVHEGRERPSLPLIVLLAVIALAYWPRWGVVIAAASATGIYLYGGPFLAPRFVPIVLGCGLVWALYTQNLRADRWTFLIPEPDVVRLALVPIIGAEFLVMIRIAGYRYPLMLVAAAVAIVAVTVIAPRPMRAISRAIDRAQVLWHRPLHSLSEMIRGTAGWLSTGPRATSADLIRKASDRVFEWRGRWLKGELPRIAALDVAPTGEVVTATPPSRLRRVADRAKYWSPPLGVWLFSTLVVNGWRVFGPRRSPEMGLWTNWDTGQYLKIAEKGYGYVKGQYDLPGGNDTPMAYLPGYSFLVKGLHNLGWDWPHALVDVTVVSGLAVALLFWKWMTLKGIDGRARFVGLLVMLWYPYNFLLYGAAYSDPLFLALALAAFVLIESDRPILAGLAGAAATITRINGLGVIAGLVIIAAVRWRDPEVRHRWRYLGALLSAGGIGSFVIWCWVRFDEPLAYWNAHSALFGKFRWASTDDWFKTDFIPRFLQRIDTDPGAMINLVVGAVLTLMTIAALPYVRRRFGGGYAAYLVMIVAVIWFGSHDFVGSGRYLTCAFPLAAMCSGAIVERPVTRTILLGTGLAFALALTYYFTNVVDLGW